MACRSKRLILALSSLRLKDLLSAQRLQASYQNPEMAMTANRLVSRSLKALVMKTNKLDKLP